MTVRKTGALAVLLLVCPPLFIHAFQIGSSPQQPLAQNAILSVGPHEGAFLILSDIHFDPFAGTDPRALEMLAESPVEKWQGILQASASGEPSRDGADSNYALLVSALEAARNSGPYDYILVTGDYLAHNLPQKFRALRPGGNGYQEFVLNTLAFVNRTIQQSFPGVPIIGALGNNDSVNGDYAAPGKPLLLSLSREWTAIGAKSDATRDFLSGGYYAIEHPTVPGQELIILDTNFWSVRFADDGSPADAHAGAAEMAWLDSKLDQVRAQGRTAALIMHIPPGAHVYESAKAGICLPPVLFWEKAYQDSFLATIRSHKASLRDSYAGHVHMNDFRVFADGGGTPYFQAHIAPSLSPDHHNPEFEIGVYDKTDGALVDYAVLYRNAPAQQPSPSSAWEPAYDFRRLSGLPSYSPASLQMISFLIRSSGTIRAKLLDLFALHTSAVSSLSPKDWLPYSCAQTELNPAAFTACACPSARAP